MGVAAQVASGDGDPRTGPAHGDVEVDETFVGGDEPGLAGGQARGRKVLVAIAVECRGGGSGRARMARIPDAGRRSLHEFITTNVAPGSTLLTDGWPPYKTIDRLGYGHKPTTIRTSTENASKLQPHVHRVAALLKRWLDERPPVADARQSSRDRQRQLGVAAERLDQRRRGATVADATRPTTAACRTSRSSDASCSMRRSTTRSP